MKLCKISLHRKWTLSSELAKGVFLNFNKITRYLGKLTIACFITHYLIKGYRWAKNERNSNFERVPQKVDFGRYLQTVALKYVQQSLFFSTTEYHLWALFFPKATLLGVWSFLLFKFIPSLQKAKHGWWLGVEIVSFSFYQISFHSFYPGKNVKTPTSPLCADKKYTHQNKFKIILPCNNK